MDRSRQPSPSPDTTPHATRTGGWLFGLLAEGAPGLSIGDIEIRPMQDADRALILRQAGVFWVQGRGIWDNTLARFPFVFEMPATPDTAIGGMPPLAVALCLLSPGEVRVPIQWHVTTGGPRGECFSSQIADLLFRAINGQFEPIALPAVSDLAKTAFPRLAHFLGAKSTVAAMDGLLLDRFLDVKRHPLDRAGPPTVQGTASRAADICMAFELLLNEGSTSEVGFRLQMSLSWLLGADPTERAAIADTIKSAYATRSGRVHGARPTTLNADKVTHVLAADRLLRRAILTRLISGLEETRWKETFLQARYGGLPAAFDRAEWLTA